MERLFGVKAKFVLIGILTTVLKQFLTQLKKNIAAKTRRNKISCLRGE